MKMPYLMMSTRGHGSLAFVDRESVQGFCVEQAENLESLLELMTACDDQYLLQATTRLAHNLAHQVQVAASVLAKGPEGQHDTDWRLDIAQGPETALSPDQPRAAA